MPKLVCNGVEIACEKHGNPTDPVLLMVQGPGMASAAWPPAMTNVPGGPIAQHAKATQRPVAA